MAWPLTSSLWSPTAAFGFRVLASLEDKVGFLPAGTRVSKRILELGGIERTKYAIASSYQTAYVMGMLYALALKAGMASPFVITGPTISAKLLYFLLKSVVKTGAHWEQVFQDLTPNEQAALGAFLVDVVLIQSSRNGEFALVQTLLDAAEQNGMSDAPLCAQCAEFLSRALSFREWAG